MIRLEVSDPYGLTGSVSIAGLYVYYSKEHFTVDTLPTPIIDNKTSYSGYSIDLPEKNTPYWIMWAYRGKDNQKVFSPIVSWVDWSNAAVLLFSARPGFVYGDAQFGSLNSNLNVADRITVESFGASPNITWRKPLQYPIWFMDKGVITGVSVVSEHLETTITDLYKDGYLGKSGDMSDVLTPDMITELGGPVEQGRKLSTDKGDFQVWVPTLAEFRTYIGSMFQTGIATTKPPVSLNSLQEGIWYLTSTQAQGGVFMLINSSGSTRPSGPTVKAAVQLLYSLELK